MSGAVAPAPSSSLPLNRRIYVSGTAACPVPFDKAWSSLLHKVRHPEKYVGSRDVKWTDGRDSDGTEFVDRVMTIGPPDQATTMHERITWTRREDGSGGTVTFKAHNDPQKDGSVLNILERRGDILTLTFTFEFAFKEHVAQKEIDGLRSQLTEGIGKVITDTFAAMQE